MSTMKSILILSLAMGGIAYSADPSLPEVVKALPGIPGGLIVQLEPDGTLLTAAAQDGRFVALGVAMSPAVGNAVREKLAKVGGSGATPVLGTASVIDDVDPTTVPVGSNTATILVADLESLGSKAPKLEEMLRAVRPDGVLYLKQGGAWKATVKPRPKEMDDWRQYFHDAACSVTSTDTLVGPPRGVQWQGGGTQPDSFGVRTMGAVLIKNDKTSHDAGVISARDAFNGVPLWTINEVQINRYTACLDESGLYFLNLKGDLVRHDVTTGKLTMTYDQGLKVPASTYMTNPPKNIWPHVRLAQGILVQVSMDKMVAIEAATGKKLWEASSAAKNFQWPVIGDGAVYAVEGNGSTHKSYMPGDSGVDAQSLVSFDLKTGAQRWRSATPSRAESFRNLSYGSGMLTGYASRSSKDTMKGEKKGTDGCYVFDAASGKEIMFTEVHGVAGHTAHTRISDGKVWAFYNYGIKSFDPKTGASAGPNIWTYGYRCYPVRFTPKLAIAEKHVGSLIDPSLYYFCELGFAPCDVGTFPSNGLLYETTGGCGCLAFMPGSNAYHTAMASTPFAGARLQKGTSSLAPAKGDGAAADEWPTFSRDHKRSNWSPAPLKTAPTGVGWTAQVGNALNTTSTIGLEQSWHSNRSGALTGLSAAEGVICASIFDSHEVFALNPSTGAVLWRVAVDGKVDAPPLIHRGGVYFGTRNGWAYCLNRDTGALVWRYLCAPVQQQIVVHGQAESVSPIIGTPVLTNDGTLWFNAGRSRDTDGGIVFVGLNPGTGEMVKSYPYANNVEWQKLSAQVDRKDRAGRQGKFTATNMMMVSDGTNLFLQGGGIVASSGERVGRRDSGPGWKSTEPNVVAQNQFGLNGRGDQERGRFGNGAMLRSIHARLWAYTDTESIGVGSANGKDYNRNGSAQGVYRFTWSDKGDPKTYNNAQVWEAAELKLIHRAADAVAVAGKVFLIGGPGSVHVLDYDTGKRTAEIKVPGAVVAGGIAICKGVVYVALDNGQVVSLK